MHMNNERNSTLNEAIEKWMHNYDCEGIEWTDNESFYTVTAKKEYHSKFYELLINYWKPSSVVNTTVYSLASIGDDKFEIALKILNESNLLEEGFKYVLYEERQAIACSTMYAKSNFQESLGENLKSTLETIMDNLEETCTALYRYDSAKGLINEIRSYRIENVGNYR